MQVSIIIVNYNTAQLLIECLESIIKHTINITYEIIIVDNASVDNSVKKVRNSYPTIKILALPDNIGFGGANNAGAKIAVGKYFFFLNTDTILFENSIKKLVSFFDVNEASLKIGALGCLLVDQNKKVNGFGSSFPSSRSEALILLNSFPFFGKYFSPVKENRQSFDEPYFPLDYVLGADLMMKASVFNQMKGFDPAFFMYYEESDLQKRILDSLGLRSYIFTGTQIIHLEGASGNTNKKSNNKKRIFVFTSRNIYLNKHDKKHIRRYKIVEKLYCLYSRFNRNYSIAETNEFLDSLRRK